MKCPLCDRTKHCGSHYCALPKQKSRVFGYVAVFMFWAIVGGGLSGLGLFFALTKLCAVTYCGGPTF